MLKRVMVVEYLQRHANNLSDLAAPSREPSVILRHPMQPKKYIMIVNCYANYEIADGAGVKVCACKNQRVMLVAARRLFICLRHITCVVSASYTPR